MLQCGGGYASYLSTWQAKLDRTSKGCTPARKTLTRAGVEPQKSMNVQNWRSKKYQFPLVLGGTFNGNKRNVMETNEMSIKINEVSMEIKELSKREFKTIQ